MKINQIEIRHLKLPLVHFFQTSFARMDYQETLIIKIRAGDYYGYGEVPASSAPYYSYETVHTAWYIIKDFLVLQLLRKTLGFSPWTLDFSRIRGHNMAKAGIEMALCDLMARKKNLSLARIYGGTRKNIPVGISLGIEKNLKDLLRRIEKSLQEGYQRIKLKIQPGWDVKVIQAVRKRFPRINLMVDANGAYQLKDWRVFRQLDKYRLMMVEQPLAYNDFVEHAQLQKRIKTPICLDESIESYHDAVQAIQLKSCRIINIKQARVGGPGEAKRIHNLAQKHDIPVWCGGLLETGIGRAHNIALASLPDFTLPGDISASARYYKEDIIDPLVCVQPDGTIKVPMTPGLGFNVVQKRLEKYTVRSEVIK